MKYIHREEQLEIARRALEDIVDPIAAMKRNLQDGEVLHGARAVGLSVDPYYLREIAQSALDDIDNIESEEG